jgi:hypothetical protein
MKNNPQQIKLSDPLSVPAAPMRFSAAPHAFVSLSTHIDQQESGGGGRCRCRRRRVYTTNNTVVHNKC